MTPNSPEPQWLTWARSLQAIAQSGLSYDPNPFDAERYEQIRTVAAEILAHHTEHDVDTVVDYFLKEVGYTTPKIGCRGAVFNTENEILLVKETDDGKWTLPGGWMEVNFTPAENTEKEIFEETGLTTRAKRIIAFYDSRKHNDPHRITHIYNIIFECEIIEGELQTSIETSDVRFFPQDKIPELSMHRAAPDQIEHAFKFHVNPTAVPIFD